RGECAVDDGLAQVLEFGRVGCHVGLLLVFVGRVSCTHRRVSAEPSPVQAGRNAAGATPKCLASVITCSLVSDRAPFRTADIVDCEIPTALASACWLRRLALISSRSTSASEASRIGTCLPS